jgi:alpha-1,6-mannosyltransferase
MHIVQVAQLVHDTSGGLRTTIDRLGAGYVEAGHRRTLIIPGAIDRDLTTEHGRVVTLSARRVPGTGGYRVFPSLARVTAILEALHPDVVEISDKVSLWRLGAWARARGVASVVVSHERLDAILAPHLPRGTHLEWWADRWNRKVLGEVNAAVAPSEFAADELRRVGGSTPVHVVPWGVDLETFHPTRRFATDGAPWRLRRIPTLVYVGRLSKEKRPELVIDCARELHRRGVRVHTAIVGSGPDEAALERRAQGLDVRFHGFVHERSQVANLLAAADVALAPCPCETFGLAALEALASGTPVVASASGALAEWITADAGRVVRGTPQAFADGVQALLTQRDRVGEHILRHHARQVAERSPWARTVRSMLAVHDAAA